MAILRTPERPTGAIGDVAPGDGIGRAHGNGDGHAFGVAAPAPPTTRRPHIPLAEDNVVNQSPPAIDEEAILELVGGDTLLLRDLVALFLDEAPGMIARIRAAIDSEDAGRLGFAAHEFKGAASYFAAAATVEAARRLEEMGRDGILTRAEDTFRILETELARLGTALSELVAPA